MIRWFGGLRPFRTAPAGAAGGTDSWVGTPELFARQRRIGFAGLRFVPRLERDYRRRFAGAHATRVTVLHLLGIVSMLLFVWFDQCVAAQALDVLGGSLLLVMGLGLAVPIIIARSRWRVVALQSGLTLGLLVANLALVALIFVLRRDDGLFPQESLLLASLYTYFMSALPLRYAVLCALVPSGVHALLTVQGLNVTPQFLPYELFYLGLANVFGITGRYLTEHQERSLYLLRLEHAHHAAHDPLTGVKNRRAFRAHAEQVWAMAARGGLSMGLAIYDLDDFKQVNDQHGHAAGDAVLVALAQTLSDHARRVVDSVGRLGGDEFVGLWCQCTEADFHRMQTQLTQRLSVISWAPPGAPVGIPASIGALWVANARTISLSAALAKADSLLYEAKGAGKGGVAFAAMTGLA